MFFIPGRFFITSLVLCLKAAAFLPLSNASSMKRGTTKILKIIGSANGSGGKVMGAEKAAQLLQRSDLMKNLHINYEWVDIIKEQSTGMHFKALPGIANTSLRLAQRVDEQIRKGDELLVIGGDHSSAIGTWSGVANAVRNEGKIGLIWIDAHLDAHRPTTSPSGNVHGMPVAHLLGFGDRRLYNIFDYFPKLIPRNLVYIGTRSFESLERMFLDTRLVHIHDQNECNRKDIALILRDAIERASFGTVGFGLSIDLDAFRPVDSPAVGTPEKGGIVASEFVEALKKANVTDLIATEIVEFIPRLDRERKTEKLVVRLIDAIYSNKLSSKKR